MAPEAFKTVELPIQSVTEEGFTFIIGSGEINTVVVIELTHPLTSVPFTVYEVVIEGLTAGLLHILQLNPEFGSHV